MKIFKKIVIYVNFSTVVAIFFFYIYKENRELEKKKKKTSWVPLEPEVVYLS